MPVPKQREVSGLQEMNQGVEFRDEVIRRLPQKLLLIAPTKSWFRRTLLFSPYFLLTGWILWVLHGRGLSSGIVLGMGGIFLLVPIIFWIFFDSFLGPFVFSRGWYPFIEYLPMEKKLVIFDLTGLQSMFRPDAQTIVHLDSLRAIVISRAPGSHGWEFSLRTRKGETVRIRSTHRETRDEVQALAQSLAAITGHPIELPPGETTHT